MVAITTSSSNSAALMILRSVHPLTASEAADREIKLGMLKSIADEFGLKNGAIWLPDMTVRSATLSGGGIFAIAGGYSTVNGTDADDDISVRNYSTAHGGKGNDTIQADGNSVGFGDEGNDQLVASRSSIVSGGEGKDNMGAAYNSFALGDGGDDTIFAFDRSQAYGGDGADSLTIVNDSSADGGDGDDLIFAIGNSNTITGGTGNDRLDLVEAKNSTVSYYLGDGADTVTVGDFWHESWQGFAPVNTIKLGNGISGENTQMRAEGNSLVITFAGNQTDRITIKFVDSSTVKLAFRDGSSTEFHWDQRTGFSEQPAFATYNYLEF